MSQNREELLFAMALEKAPGKRNAFLDSMCEGDPVLRRRLEELLAAHEASSAAIEEQQPAKRPAVTIALDLPEIEDESVGQTLGRYKLLEKVGEGGCGVVYVAEQTEPVRRRVALKVIKLGMDTKQVVARFEAERQALAMMDHPNIAKVLDAGTTDKGRPYFVMELVRGIRITDYCDQEKLSTKDRLGLFIKVCHAIQHAHQKGIIHRDIKPSNILVTLHDGVPVPKVIDFGIAKATEGRLTDNTVYTQLHQFIGTPAYMSPEQAEMSGLDIDTRSDIYSLGVLLYELLADSTPFDPKELMAYGIDAMRKTIREKEPQRPSTRLATLGADQLTTTAKRRSADTSKLLHQLKGDLDWIVMKCLEKDRQRRYDTANGLAADLKRHLNNEPVVARPPSAAYRFQKAFRRNKLVYAASAAVLLALATGLGLATDMFLKERAARRREQDQRLKLESALAMAQTERKKAGESARKAQEAALVLRHRSYAADMKAAQVAIEQNSRGQAALLLANYIPQSGEEDQRGVEWRYLVGQLRGDEVESWKLGDGLITWLGCTPDDRYVLSATVDKKLKVHDNGTGRIVTEIDFVSRFDSSYLMSDDGRFLACGSAAGLSVFSAPDWKLVFHIPSGEKFTFSPDGHLLAIQIKQSIRVFDTTTWQPSPSDIPSVVDSMVFREDGKSLLVARQGKWRVFSVPTGKEVTNFIPPVEPAGRFIHDRTRRFLFSLTTGSLKLRRADTMELLWTSTNIHTANITSITFSRDGQMLATASFDQTLALWRMSDGALIGRLRGHQNEVWSLDASADGKFLLSAGKDGVIKKWRWSAPTVRTRVLGPNEIIAYPLGRKDHLVTIDPIIGSFNPWSESGQTSWPIHSNLLSQIPHNQWASGVYLDESKNLVFITATNSLVFYPTSGGSIERHVQLGQGTFLGWSLSSNKRWLCLVCQADSGPFGCQRIQIWDLSNGHLVRELAGVSGFTWAYSQQTAFSRNSSFLAFPDGNHEIVVWNLQKDREERRLRGSSWHVNHICFSNGGDLLAAAGWDGMVYLWDLTSGQLKTEPMQGHGSGVIAVGFSKDDRTLVSSGDDDTVRFWSTSNGLEMLRLNDRVSPQSLWEDDSLLFSKQSRIRKNTACLIEKIPSFSEIQAESKHTFSDPPRR